MSRQVVGLAALAALLALAACKQTCPAGAQMPATVATAPESGAVAVDSEHTKRLIEAAERFANQTCACTSTLCSDSASRDFTDWLRAHPRREGSPLAAKRIIVAMEKVLLCRDRLAYPDEPVDLEASAPGA